MSPDHKTDHAAVTEKFSRFWLLRRPRQHIRVKFSMFALAMISALAGFVVPEYLISLDRAHIAERQRHAVRSNLTLIGNGVRDAIMMGIQIGHYFEFDEMPDVVDLGRSLESVYRHSAVYHSGVRSLTLSVGDNVIHAQPADKKSLIGFNHVVDRELASVLQTMRQSGKPVVSRSNYPGTRQSSILIHSPIYAQPEISRHSVFHSVPLNNHQQNSAGSVDPDFRTHGTYIGFTSVELEIDYQNAVTGEQDPSQDYIGQLAITGPQGVFRIGASGPVPSKAVNVAIAGGEFELMLSCWPTGNWGGHSSEPFLTRMLGYSFSVLSVGLLLYLFLFQSRQSKMLLHDPLTGLPNRRLVMDRLTQLIALFERSGARLSLYYIDLNEFKTVNDSYGHAAGDRLLCQIANRLLSTMRETDTVGRIGGDEFVVIMPWVDGRTADENDAVMARIRNCFIAPVFVAGAAYNAGGAIGVAHFPADARSGEELIKVADKRMYEEKRKRENAANLQASRRNSNIGTSHPLHDEG